MRARNIEPRRPIVVVIGCDEIGSAITHALHVAGAAAVLVDDADPPWARRGMSYVDAWYVGGATLDRVDACFCGSVKSIPAVLARGDMIAATTWSWEGLANALRPRAVVETRPGCRIAIAHARPPWLDGVLTIGVRTTQVAGWRADVVIAGAPGADFVGPPRLGPEANAVIGERRGTVLQLEAPHAGRFRTRHEIAGRVEVGDVLGELGAFAVVASGSGMLTALAARGARVAPGHVLAEIDATADLRACFGIAPNARAIARRVAAAIRGATPADRPEPAAASTGFA